MKSWPDTDGSTITRYLGQLRLRYRISPIYYRQALRSFQEVVVRCQCPPSQVSRDAVEAWLRERAARWSASTLLHRARIVNRFLDFLVQEELIASNPVADLRAEYSVKSSKAILRTLLAPDSDQALEALRQFPPFGSVLGDLMRNRIALMRTRGFRYETQARWFWRFDRFLQAYPELAEEPVSVMLQRWRAARPTPNHQAECERLARALVKAQRHVDPSIEPKRPDPRPGQQVARQWRHPYIYSPEEVRRLLNIARTYPSPRALLRPISLYTMLVLAYCAGLRVGELARLNLARRRSAIGHDHHSGDEVLQIPESCLCPAARCRRWVGISMRDARRRRRKARILACSGMTREAPVIPLKASRGASLTYCGAPGSSRRRARRGRASTICVTRSW